MSKKQKKKLYRIISDAFLLIGAVLISRFTALPVWAELILFLIPYFWIGWDVLWSAIRNIGHGQVFDEKFLMSVATLGALTLREYPEAVFVMMFFQVGELFEKIAVGKSRKSISGLMDIRPDYANLEQDGKSIQVSPQQVKIGDIIFIKPGEKIPLDGEITEGSSSINTTALTGESLPRDVAPGDSVISGCVNMNGLLKVRVTATYGESTVSKILDLVENSSMNKARSENFITRFSRYYTPIVVLSAVLLAVIPPLIDGNWGQWIQKALIFLVVSCPCALVISVPLSFFGGIGGASKQGILVKGANYLEILSKTGIVVFDKTGTLTHGNFAVTAVHPKEISEAQLLEYAALAESYSTHPISISLREAYGKKINQDRLGKVEEISGHGVIATVDGKQIAVGNGKLMNSLNTPWKECHKIGTTIHVAVDGIYAGHIVISDQIKDDSVLAVKGLKTQGIKCVMLTGDRAAVGEAVGKELNLDEVHTELLPADKVRIVEKLLSEKSKDRKLAFVGDGINDAPVLTRADIGIAMGALGSDAAIEAADVVLMDDKPSKIAQAIQISRRTKKIVVENITFALLIKFLVMIFAVIGWANMWAASFADVGVSVLAILNAIRALKTK